MEQTKLEIDVIYKVASDLVLGYFRCLPIIVFKTFILAAI